MSDQVRATTSTAVTLVGRSAGRVLQFATMVVLARTLGPRAFGAFALGWIVVRTLAYVATAGVELGAIHFGAPRHGADPAAHKALLVACVTITAIAGCALAVVLAALGAFAHVSIFADPEVAHVLRLFAIALVPMALLITLSAATRVGTSGVYATVTEDVLQPLACIAGVLLALRSGLTLTGAVAAFDVSFALGALAAATAVTRVFGSSLRATARRDVGVAALLAYSAAAAVPSRLGLLVSWSDRLVVGHFRPAAEVGVYQAASQCAMHVPILLSAVAAGVSPAIAAAHHRGDEDSVARVFMTSARWALALSLPWSIVLLVAPGTVLTVLFGSRYDVPDASFALQLVAAGQLVNAATGTPGALLAMTGRPGVWAATTAAALAGEIAAAVAVVPRWGIVGAACATSGATALLNLIGVGLAWRVMGRAPFDRRVLVVVAAGAAATAAALGVRALVQDAHAALALETVASLGVMALVVAAGGGAADARAYLERLTAARAGRGADADAAR